jgi:hypothetical protein
LIKPGRLRFRPSPKAATGAEPRTGVRHIKTYGTAWGGYVLIDVDDPEAFARYQLHHGMNYGHMVHLTFDPVYDLDAALADRTKR